MVKNAGVATVKEQICYLSTWRANLLALMQTLMHKTLA